ncbi:glycosyl transferase family 2 [Gibbsiella quercinecans]|uniref:Glycosyl transferase n=1 Tax=Gibbsiella quercinecans TaxID=929813 RepID=A0A250B9G7_9GAMM|nr:glycosyltransferase family 2 protein [Gibbsiella quercinecans]ATA22592.1 glycosyl transferase [Gibbsiella quercinecans]RLM08277.1 glycosyl transferase [Gibbsiella quercinecans]TCT85326.1 glycosyl transferase family 2 [Gibbsiella quercinecans]
MESVSVIMPVYNAASFIKQSILGVLAQTYQDYHLYVIDDASTDNTAEVIKPFIHDRLTYIRNDTNQGVAETRNIAIEAARGGYIAFCDSDDIWHKNKLARQVGILQTGRYDVVCSHYCTFEQDPQQIKHYRGGQEIIAYRDMLKSNWIGNLTGIYNRHRTGKVFQRKVGHEDYVMWLSVMEKARNRQAYCVPEPLAFYRLSAQSLSGNKIKAADWQWQIYRRHLGFSYQKSCYLFCSYLYNAAMKRQ